MIFREAVGKCGKTGQGNVVQDILHYYNESHHSCQVFVYVKRTPSQKKVVNCLGTVCVYALRSQEEFQSSLSHDSIQKEWA